MGKTGMLSGMAIGAGLAYLLDPQSGPERRERLERGIRERVRERAGESAGDEPSDPVTPSAIGRYGSRKGDLAGLESATLPRRPGALMQSEVAILGGALTLYGLVRRGAFGALARTLGVGMVVSGLRDARNAARPAGGERRRTVDIQQTLFVRAPVDKVYEFWADYENFPLFLSNVREVQDLGGGRSHWVVRGPGGLPIEWDAELTENVPGRSLAWRSRPGSLLENAGVVRFRTEGDGTRVELRFCYNPPAGGAGQAFAELLGADPRNKLNEDLGRLKSLLEGVTRSESHGRQFGRTGQQVRDDE